MKITGDVSGLENLAKRIEALTVAVRDKRGVTAVAPVLAVSGVQDNFRRQKNADGTNWPRLKFRSGTPLVDKIGRMPKGITYGETSKGWKIAAGAATKAYNAVHNFGSQVWHGSGKRKGVPQRQYMYLTRAYADKIARAVQGAVKRQIRGR